MPALATRFLALYPHIELDWLFTDRRIDLLAEGIDVAIRAGNLADSSLVGRKVGITCFGLFASPAYLQANRPIQEPEDLQHHACLRFTGARGRVWQLSNRQRSVHLEVQSRLQANDLMMIKHLATGDYGIALLPVFICHADMTAQYLCRVLPAWSSASSAVHVVYLSQRYLPAHLQAFLNVAADTLRKALSC